MSVLDSFKLLRGVWFYEKLYNNPHERVWETEEEEKARVIYNIELRKKYDLATERIIQGEPLTIAPLCANDILKIT